MTYEHLRNFLIIEMKPDRSDGIEKNYQPVMIRFLNQKENGSATKEEIIAELQMENSDRELPSGVLKTVSDTLIRNKIVRQQNNSFVLIDHENFGPGEKAEITKKCEDRINGEEKSYFVLDNEEELGKAQKLFLENLKKYTTKQDRIIIGFPGPTKKLDENVHYISNVDFWWHSHDLPDEEIPRFWNAFGPGEPIWGKNNSVTLEINPPMKEISRRVGGAFVKDGDGNIFICHNGGLGGGNTPGGFDEVYPHQEKWIQADDGRKKLRKLILISDITSPELPEQLADYVKLVAQFKAGKLSSQKAPYYLLLRHKSEDNPYEDDPSGKMYHFPHNANHTKVIPNAKTIWYDKINGTRYFWGYGTVAKRITRPDDNFEAIFDDFTLFDRESDSIEKHGKFLKKATPKIEERIENLPGFNVQHSISEINKEIFDEIVGSVQIIEERFQEAHKAFENEMLEKSDGIAFTDFNHPHLLKDEINYKQEIAEKTKDIRSEKNLQEWIKSKGMILEKLKEVCSQSTAKNLMMGANYGIEKSSAASLHTVPENLISEYEQILFDFITFANKSQTEFGEKFDNLIEFLTKNNLKTDWRFLAYLSFISNPEKYFPIQPTLFEKLMEFYGNQYNLRASYSWKLYSRILKLAELLKVKLEKYGGLDAIQIQSYMWVIANLINSNKIPLKSELNYWIIRPGSDGEEWENQKNNEIAAIAYFDPGPLTQFYDENGDLSEENKSKLRETIAIAEISQGYEEGRSKEGKISQILIQFNYFMGMKTGDKILAIDGFTKILGKGTITDNYSYNSSTQFCHTFPVKWDEFQGKTASNAKPWQGTIKSITLQEYEEMLSDEILLQEYAKFFNILRKKKQFFFYGPPGTGKTFTAKKIAEAFTNSTIDDRGPECNQIEMVTFHQSFSYEEFVEGIRPHTNEETNQVTYPIEDGIFKKMCKCAESKPDLNFVLIIDEINRGNISKILGELITLLENDKRGDQVTLPYSKKLFSVPQNLYIIGTMNTADRSLVHLDAALKRRFGQYELMPDTTLLDAKVRQVHLGRLLYTLNQKILDENFRDNQIGHSYFMKDANPITTVEELQFAFAYDIVPLLKDYFYDDDKILNNILGGEFIDENRNIILEWTEDESLFMKSLEKAYPEAFD